MRKHLLLFLALLAIAGMSFAQDIYSVGNFTNSSGYQCAAVYLNNQKLYEKVPPLGDYNFDSPSLVVVGDDVYWAMNSTYATGGYYYGDIYRNGNVYLNSPGDQSFHINDLAYGGGHLYAGGSKYFEGSGLVGGGNRAVIWRDDDVNPYYVLTDNTHLSGVTAITYYNGNLYSAGWQSNGSGSYDAIIWKNNTQYYNLGSSVSIADIAYYNGNVYTVANNNSSIKVYKNNQVMYTLTDNWNGNIAGESICIDAGNIYVTGHVHSDVRVWRNGQMLSNITQYDEGNSLASVANHKGVYHAGYADGQAYVWRNGSAELLLYQCNVMNDLYVDLPCEDDNVRSLPFSEGFENNQTDWSCWINTDADNNNGDALSFWHRCGTRVAQAASGDYFVGHGGNTTVNQQGWLVSPRLYLQPNRDNTTLTFKTACGPSGSAPNVSVRVSTNSNPNNADAYTQVWTTNSLPTAWETVTIDLSAYQGQAVYIAFRYSGVGGLDWYIDDIQVTENWTPCIVTHVPYNQTFTGGADGCWYIIDKDMGGGNYYWKHDEVTQSMMHPYGPSGVFQKGMLFSHRIDLESGHDYVLRFKTMSQSSGSNMSNRVRIALDEEGAPDPSHYYTVLWTDQEFSSYWDEVSIPLTSYAGHVVTICFDYEGTYAHKWFIDDVRIEEAVSQYTITVNANNNAWGSVTGGGDFNPGESCTISATPASGYQFLNWKKNGTIVSTNASYTFTVTETATYTAYFGETPINYYTVNTGVDPEGAGSVSGGGTYQEGSSITLIATSNAGYMFNHWNDGNTDNPRTVTVTQDITYTAYYDLEEYTIQVYASPSEGGTVSGGGNYHYGETATLTATPKAGYEFAGWSDGNNDNPREVIVTSATYYVAVFNEAGTNYYTVSTYVNPEGAGTVTGGGTYQEATVTALIAEANLGYVFDHWSDGVVANPRVITVNDNMSFTAYFNQNIYTITVNANPASGGIVEGDGSYIYGSTATLYAIPNGGYVFAGWSDGSSENPHYVTVTGDATYTATFSPAGATYYTVSTHVSPTEAGTVTGAGTYQEGTSATLKATANAGYAFDHWNDGVTQNPRTVTVDNNKSFTAYFTANTYTLTVNANPANGGTVTGGGTYGYGESVVLTATPSANYSFMRWSDGNASNPRAVTVTEDMTYTAYFQSNTGVSYILTLICNTEEGMVVGGGVYAEGESATVQAFPKPGYEFEFWNDGNKENPRTVTMNEDLVLVAFFKSTGVDENQQHVLSIYPNPANESIRIDGLDAACEIQIYNSLGVMVKVFKATTDQEIGIGDLASGLYLLRCGSQSIRFIKK